MNAIRITAVVLGGACLAALAACNEPGAKVLEAKAITEVVRTPREECSDQVVTRQKTVKDENRVLGTVAGAIVGGVIGHEVGGKGTSQDVATVGGAAAGGIAGNQIQKSVQKNATEEATERVCRTVYDSSTEATGAYRVRYVLDGKEGSVTMDHDPGDSIPVRDGQLVL